MPDPLALKPSDFVVRGKHGIALLLVGIALVAGCRPKEAASDFNTQVTVSFDPNPPAVGVTGLKVTLADADGKPVRLGHIDVEGNMNHAGMKPAFGRLDEVEPGHYTGKIEFTMGGDWFLLLTGQREGGGAFEKKIDVPGVKPK
jgi:hypothetical protein